MLNPCPLPYPEEARQAAVDVLNPLAVDVQVFAQMVHRAHTAVRGSHAASALHALFGEVYAATAEYADQMTELVELLGGEGLGSAEELAEGSRLEPWPAGVRDVDQLCRLVFERASVLLAWFEDTLGQVETLQVPYNRTLNIQESLAFWAWKVGANIHDAAVTPPHAAAPEQGPPSTRP